MPVQDMIFVGMVVAAMTLLAGVLGLATWEEGQARRRTVK